MKLNLEGLRLLKAL